ncbi:MAG TPA: lamin tail domain-containing protein, partial [Tepidisphaeraceae bacterium]
MNWAKGSNRRGKLLAGAIERLEPRQLLAGVQISEFLASNTKGITDEDGDHSDWIELHNTDAAAFDLTGWYLTDDAANLTKWQLPATSLPANGYLTVFASSKNRRVVDQPLHTNFSLSKSGEYLGLVMPDGTTVSQSFAPFPAQKDDVSYGIGAGTDTSSDVTLVGASTSLRVISPTGENPAVDDNWREIGFDDSAWLSGTRSIGFDRDSDGVNLLPFIGRVLADNNAEMPTTTNPRYTAYVRYAFNVADKDQLSSLKLDLRFDDGFIAYLNGH